jgi:hypothetical protein
MGQRKCIKKSHIVTKQPHVARFFVSVLKTSFCDAFKKKRMKKRCGFSKKRQKPHDLNVAFLRKRL